MPAPVVYLESQRFLRHWWALLLVPAVVAAVPVALQLSKQWPHLPQLPWLGGATAVFITFLLLTLRLDLRLDAAGVHYRMAPFHQTWRHRSWSEISRAYVRSYDPLGEYGGWGLKGSRRNRALNVAGSDGLQLELHDGTRLLLGSQHPAELRHALAALYASPPPAV